MSFANLKTRSTNIDALVQAAEAAGGKPQSAGKDSYVDDRLWKPTVDKAGNGYAVLRFLPASEGEDLPWVRYWDHAFQGPTGQWFIENCRTSLNGEACPVCEQNSKLWNTGLDDDKVTVRKQKRRLHYVANVLVVNDPSNPQNEGKVFLYKFGKKIFDKIMDVMQPQFQDEDPVNPFDFWEGADFKLKIRNVEGYRNYDKSEFASPAQLFGGDESKLEALYNSQYSLKEFVDPNNYKPYNELKAKMARVLGEEGGSYSTAEQISLDETAAAPKLPQREQPAMQERESFDPVSATSNDSSEDDTLSYFAKLANDS